MHRVFHLDCGIHPVGLFRQPVQLELQHIVLCDRAELFVAPPCHAVERVGVGVVRSGDGVIALGRGESEEKLRGVCGDEFEALHVGRLGLTVADGFDATVPLQAVVAKERLLVAELHRGSLPGRRVVGEHVEPGK